MQIYILDKDPIKSARYHTNIHVSKMLTESLQVLSTVCHLKGQNSLAIYSKTHINHPCVKWASASIDNYLWLYDMTKELYNEYKYRYGEHKTHLAGEKFKKLGIPYIKEEGLTPFVYGFNNPKYWYDDVVQGYRDYLINEKAHCIKYKRREKPEWMEED